ncbi:tetratricopeptide repeat protein [Rheinheimera sp.]|uniref:tetratricopeptide repeat protein n=1 Tax=Rheinheimera sp. TaxID=1869214 RepID=UPI00307D53F7
MKPLLIALTLLTTAVQAASIDQIDAAANRMQLTQLTDYAKGTEVSYPQAYAQYRLAVISQVAGNSEQFSAALQQARQTLEQLTAQQPDAENLALLSSVYGLMISESPLKNGAKYGKKAAEALAKAEQLAPDNPRVLLVKAISAFNTPAVFGGSKTAAAELASQAIAQFSRPCTQICWGQEEAYTWRGLASMDAGNKDAAVADWQQALQLNPDYGWARFLLEQQQRYSQN